MKKNFVTTIQILRKLVNFTENQVAATGNSNAISPQLSKKVTRWFKYFCKNRFYLLHEEDNLENVIIEKNMDSEKSNNINEH